MRRLRRPSNDRRTQTSVHRAASRAVPGRCSVVNRSDPTARVAAPAERKPCRGQQRRRALSLSAAGDASGDKQTWYTFNGDLAAQKFATSTQITPDNVNKLAVAWQLHTGDVSRARRPEGQAGHI